MTPLRPMMTPLAQALRVRPAARIAQQTRGIKFQGSPRRMSPVPRIRTLKKIPPELIPLGIVLAVAVGAAGYSLVRKLMTDGTLRLYRQGTQAPSKGH
ncbi:hypothetical protein ANO11243_023620 [Dothideomycetidae sp. 11243]|nr:hypothetical protein ANO11243_023620 [fungal sp. No.11243]